MTAGARGQSSREVEAVKRRYLYREVERWVHKQLQSGSRIGSSQKQKAEAHGTSLRDIRECRTGRVAARATMGNTRSDGSRKWQVNRQIRVKCGVVVNTRRLGGSPETLRGMGRSRRNKKETVPAERGANRGSTTWTTG